MPSINKNYRVVIADDHEIIRTAVTDYIKQATAEIGASCELLAFAENGLEAIAAVKQYKPDLIFLDISMPLATGVEIIHDIRRWSPDSKIIVFTGVTASSLLTSIVEHEVEGLFSKGSPVEVMRESLPLILQGGRYIAPELLSIIERGQQVVSLTERERQVLNKIIAGKTSNQMAEELFISPKTVEKHRTSLMSKLEVRSMAQLLARALKDGLIESS
jgi:DNA-binding NarL/FixJ family response regulator